MYQIINQKDVPSLAIDTQTGVITTTRPLSYANTKQLLMEVSATVQGQTKLSKTGVYVDVVNVNDNPPVFTRSSITVYVAENSGEIPSLVCLFAIDKDGDARKYSIKNGNIGNVFSINENTGEFFSLFVFR